MKMQTNRIYNYIVKRQNSYTMGEIKRSGVSDEIEKGTDVPGSTLRGALKSLKEAHLVDSEAAKCFAPTI